MADDGQVLDLEHKNELQNNRVSIIPLDSKDVNSGKCRMDVYVMKLAGFKLNTAICIAVKNYKFYCSVWPSSYRNISTKYVHFDTSVVLTAEVAPQVGDLSGCWLNLRSDITPVEIRVAKYVEVEVYIGFRQETSARIMYDKTRRTAQVKCVLRGKVFAKHCWVCVKRMSNCSLGFIQEIDRIYIKNVEYFIDKVISHSYIHLIN